MIEVADTTLATDRGWKRRLYAEARIAVYWIVNIVDRVVEVHTDPHGTRDTADYATIHIYQPGDAIALTIAGPVAALIH